MMPDEQPPADNGADHAANQGDAPPPPQSPVPAQDADGDAGAGAGLPVVVPAAHAAGPEPVAWSWPAVHGEGYKFAAIPGLIAAIGFFLDWRVIPWLALALACFVLEFFRDPRRASPAGEGLILSPADGLISQIVPVSLPRQLVGVDGLPGGTATRISVFMSVFDVHINRTPVAGRVTRIAYVPGAFLSADLDKASEENERQYFVVEAGDGTRIGFTQIAGLVARRIKAFVHVGDELAVGQRIGLIRFGSRVDIFLPAGFQPQVLKGQRAVAGETVLAARRPAVVPAGPRA